MKEHYDICVAGFWYGYNYGFLLNGYAEYRLLKDMDKEVLMLQKPGAKENDPEIARGHNMDFVKKYYDENDISPVLPYDRLGELNERCDCFCAGPDQIWNYMLSFRENMFLPFVNEDKRCISFATSFGYKTDKTPSEARDRVKKYLKRFGAISVCESFDVEILENNYGIKSSLVFEPAFCLEKSIYEKMAAESTFEETEPYMLAYILDPTSEKRDAISYFAKTSGMKVVIILDGEEESWERKRQAMNLPNILSSVGVEDFLKVYMNASFVLTDNFHGAVFAVIFNKSFLCIGNYGRGHECFAELFDRLKITDRLVADPKNIPLDDKYLKQVDYTETNQIIEEEKNKTIEWLGRAVEPPLEELLSTNIEKKDVENKREKRVVDEKSLRIIKNVKDYLEQISKLEDALVIIGVKDTVGLYFDDELQKKIYHLGLKENLVEKFRVGYIAIINNRVPVFEEIAEESGTLKYETKIDDINISVTSLPLGSGNKATIQIDGIDYAINQRGLNIVSYDLKNHSLIDSVAFDTHEKELTCHRQTDYMKTKKHYDICVAGFWYGYNYGSLLNGYAEYLLLKSFNKQVLMLQKPLEAETDSEISKGHNTKFVQEHYDMADISPSLSYDKLEELNDLCDCFCAGSDQIWNYNLSFHENLYLPFVHKDKKLISFATSFGHKVDKVPLDARDRVRTYLKRFHAVSVRENFDVEILKNNYGINGTLVFEPVFCLERNIYEELAEESSFEEDKPYMLAYILDPTPEKRKAIMYYAQASNMKAIIILSGTEYNWEKNKKEMNLSNVLSSVGVVDFLKAFMNASFIITDSFHGSAFSIIFNKTFLCIGNYGRGYERFVDLFERLKIDDRLIINPKIIPHDENYLQPIDYSETNKIIQEEKEKNIRWLRWALDTPIENMPAISIPQHAITTMLKQEECMGCGACVCICPVDALNLQADQVGYYRSFVDCDKCIDCGKCSSVCPALHLPKNDNDADPDCFEFIASDKQVLFNSSSGGIFALLAERAFQQEGLVAGAAWCDDFSVAHIIIDKKNDLHKLQKSKYLQSYQGKIFREIKEHLDNKRFILFSGCPCQVTGLKAYLRKDYDNLLTVDLLCSYSPSAMFFQKYILEAFPNGIKEYEFRNKSYRWDCITIKAVEPTGTKQIRSGGSEDAYQRVYHNHTMCPSHCEKCKYQSVPRFGDLTIGDFWGISKKDPQIDSKEGVSVILCNNKKGRDFLESIPDTDVKVRNKVPLQWLGGNGYAINESHNYCSPQRDSFYKAIRSMSFQKATNYALKPNHGEYLTAFKGSNAPLQFSSSFMHFRFDSSVWDELTVNGMVCLMVKRGMSKEGRFAVMPLCQLLDKNNEYLFSIRFRIKTTSNTINFHIKDSGTKLYQIIYSHRLKESYNSEDWIEVNTTFKPKSDVYDEFMIGASQVSGPDNYIYFDYINIRSMNS